MPEATIYVYDNNSTDGTDEIARAAGAVVRYEYRQGKGNVIRSMFREIDADCYLMIDGDDTYPAENARHMVDLVLNKGVDMESATVSHLPILQKIRDHFIIWETGQCVFLSTSYSEMRSKIS